MKPIPKMDIDTALSYMSREKAIDLMWRRLFCNADETVNTIAEHDIRKQIPQKPLEDEKLFPDGIRYSEDYICPSCGKGFSRTGIADFCYHCGQALDWSDDWRENK